MSGQRQRRGSESGYALITILFLMGVVAVMLARSLPRDAMRAERTREETLIYRGEQYARAVKLYFREHQRYPESLNDLEQTDGVRFLRRRYRDPITGADEWRLIKMGADGRFEDSLVYDTEKEDGTRRPGGGSAPPIYAAAGIPGMEGAENRAAQQRESAAPTNPFERARGQYGTLFGIQPPAAAGSDETQVREDGQPARGSDEDYSQVRPELVPIDAGQRRPNDPRGLAGSRGAQTPERAPSYATPPTAGFGRDGISPQASDVIGRLLTTPRPGGLAGLQGQTTPQEQGQMGAQAAFQEGIAGVASKSERSGVKIYKDREFYHEWEFVYDYRDDAQAQGFAAAAAPQNGGGNPIGQGQPGITPSGVLGGNPGARQQVPIQLPGMGPAPAPVLAPSPMGSSTTSPTRSVRPRSDTSNRDARGGRIPRSPAQYRPTTPVPVVEPEAAPGEQPQQR